MRLLDGRAMAAEIGRGVVDEVERLAETDVTPTLAVVVPSADPAALSYVQVIERTAGKVGVAVQVHHPAGGPDELAAVLDKLAVDRAVHGVLVQTPLPAGRTAGEVGVRIPPVKDVDGMNPLSLGRLALGLPAFPSATAEAVVEILRRAEVPLAGARACVIGRGPVVGKPAALLLLAEDATVTVCHSRTKDLATVAHEADIVVAAVGQPKLVGAGFVRPGATVVDVGTNVTDAGLVGDVDVDAIAPVAGALTPVPGGVGPVTTMLLLRNTVLAARHSR
ncbi:bifunctional 5,10-methylenetetrahydrofolate dehydrogenase/5,10-methenyltetrahydrofolate cyclohydrolase [Frankia sp. CNm7]|uniref:Bifunctional protein FolD n=1 Tax=Frankia nepalensis TaxID=1836974 RepID=A0A937RFV9_9ACTN|nr:bifunctional 5,10-methylenetetrahydrofolate dehydrogenase/5,10-methenyltetrahydrofolate cyclohydrolase [Frankia nepalensis]MBL7498914.1 bifunctional 5,10-methylenetetrahydrofolate dehydrogenase/5,10-methenyltetrahydrofolate cyclohydrolase [Frankia nepalensis]MBL7513084.1 bifunctional 5,10-methylenetetrahydrofolate dehydrogenase/5,10-methenyltetrahydrofolate cyclohydrolase [Frankia nepalensis]MBL7522213.1 bifunctional 5,10-methylenetetrahydrofolate dehydrogenase/5,10-methenyltetrahydrofolate c